MNCMLLVGVIDFDLDLWVLIQQMIDFMVVWIVFFDEYFLVIVDVGVR